MVRAAKPPELTKAWSSVSNGGIAALAESEGTSMDIPQAFEIRAVNRVDWDTIRPTVKIVDVIRRCLGDPLGRRGSQSTREWWRCPFHADRNPSLTVRGNGFRCFGCGAKGDAVAFVRRFNQCDFLDAVRFLAGREAAPMRPQAPALPPEPRRAGRAADWQEAVAAIVSEAEANLWKPEAAEALAHLRRRGLQDESIRRARLGYSSLDRRVVPTGIVIPWQNGEEFTLVNVRRPDGLDPKYRALAGSRRGGIYPGSASIRPGKPLIIVEGEFDALLLGQELEGVASVVTLGSASARPDATILGEFLVAAPWYIATDNDPAGDATAAAWAEFSASRRVRPPSAFKDWGDAFKAFVNLRRWWSDILIGDPSPALFTWEELSRQRWGPAIADAEVGCVINSEPKHDLAALMTAVVTDPYAAAEREAIQAVEREA